MLSGTEDRSGVRLSWALIVSAILHVFLVMLIAWVVIREMSIIAKGQREQVSQTETITMDKRVTPTPEPRPQHVVVRVQPHSAPPAALTPRHELAMQDVHAPPQPPQPRHRPTVTSNLALDQAGYAKEVAQLNKANDPRAIPTIDPSTQESSSKSFGFNPGGGSSGDKNGNGIITPTQSWRDHGLDCYYGRYEYTHPDGSEEDGNIVWPFCYEPGEDPFKQAPHLIPFPPPLPGYKLPPGTDLPPYEKAFYEQWAGSNGAS